MKLKNKKTGEIVIADITHMVSGVRFDCGQSLAELNSEWEDYKEPKKYYYINDIGAVQREDVGKCGVDELARKEIGNYFETEEEAEKAVRKLEAWKRLKSHNLRVERGQRIFVNTDNKLTSQKPLFVVETYGEVEDDLDLLFSGEGD